jgi:hypothetical protein
MTSHNANLNIQLQIGASRVDGRDADAQKVERDQDVVFKKDFKPYICKGGLDPLSKLFVSK